MRRHSRVQSNLIRALPFFLFFSFLFFSRWALRPQVGSAAKVHATTDPSVIDGEYRDRRKLDNYVSRYLGLLRVGLKSGPRSNFFHLYFSFHSKEYRTDKHTAARGCQILREAYVWTRKPSALARLLCKFEHQSKRRHKGEWCAICVPFPFFSSSFFLYGFTRTHAPAYALHLPVLTL